MPRQEFTSYCSICGGPILGRRSDGSWISKVTLLSGSKPRFNSRIPQHKNVQHEPDLEFESISADGIYETAAELNFAGEGRGYRAFRTGEHTSASYNNPLMIGVHAACLHIAKRMIRLRANDGAGERLSSRKVTSMRRLWEVLQSRDVETVEGNLDLTPRRLLAPHNYHMPSYLGGVSWEDGAGEDVLNPYEADPVNIPDLSSHVLSYLQAYPQDCTRNATCAHASLVEKVRRLPTELFDHIIDSMGRIHNIPIQCTRIIEPVYWQRLLCGRFLPYLWDLDISVIQYCLSDEKWDYELLVRQLAQEGIWDFFMWSDQGKHSHGIWNRRRIWRLLEEMEVGDAEREARREAGYSSDLSMPFTTPRQPRPPRAPLTLVIPPALPIPPTT